MSAPPPERDDDGSVDVEAAWADIVAHWDDDATAATGPPGAAAPPGAEDAPERPSQRPATGGGRTAEPEEAAGTGAPAGDVDATDPVPAPPTGDGTWRDDDVPADDGEDDGWGDDEWDAPRSHVGGQAALDVGAHQDAVAARSAAAEDDERYVPPEPPPLPTGDTVSRLAWGAVLGAPLFFLLAALFWRSAPTILVVAAVAAFVAGFATLVLRMPDRDDDDPDEGAVV
ncbi:hypothetical protein [Thalassiella azotivora]